MHSTAAQVHAATLHLLRLLLSILQNSESKLVVKVKSSSLARLNLHKAHGHQSGQTPQHG